MCNNNTTPLGFRFTIRELKELAETSFKVIEIGKFYTPPEGTDRKRFDGYCTVTVVDESGGFVMSSQGLLHSDYDSGDYDLLLVVIGSQASNNHYWDQEDWFLKQIMDMVGW